MPARFIIVLSLLLPWLAGCTNAPAGAGVSRYGRTTVITGEFPVLEKGMTVEEVRQKLGDPAEVRPMKPAEGNAEIWIYYLEKFVGRTQVITGLNRPAFSGALATNPSGMSSEPFYTMADRKVLVTLRLLMLNGRLIMLATKREEFLDF